MKLHELQATEGSRHNDYRRGRGIGSGNGKTAGKGHKGQNSRSGMQTHVHPVGDAIQPSHRLLSPSPAFNLSQHQGLFQ